MREVSGKVAVVTGAASGMGRAMSLLFAREGMKVVLSDIDAADVEAVAAEIREGGGVAVAVPTDVSSASAVDALRTRTLEEFGTAHLVCLNAGVGGSGELSWEVPLSVWQWQLRVNFLGIVNGIRAFLPVLVGQAEGHVVVTSSMAGLFAGCGSAPYSASKYAVTGMAETVKLELEMIGSPVKISTLIPGPTGQSRMSESLRLWPSDLGPLPQRPPGGDRVGVLPTPDVLKQAMASKMSPSFVADLVLDAVRNERFWILPYRSETSQLINERTHALVHGDGGGEAGEDG
jgi:NAD(P)-dependent dehydrogenase (short-subunit alcohol dehydrogenase family)